jgi:alanyl-tRNA synthetase
MIAPHLLHALLRQVLGTHVKQAGSVVDPGRLRFDFRHYAGLDRAELEEVERLTNQQILKNTAVQTDILPLDQAIATGAMALFGEKYGDEVRVVSVGDWARELCGGTHAQRSGQLGVVKLLGESSIGAGVRRVEALVGSDAYDFLAREHALVGQLTEALKVRPEELPERVASILARLREAEKEIDAMRTQQVLSDAATLVDQAQDVFGVRVVSKNAGEGVGADDLRTLVLDVRGRLGDTTPAVVAVAGVAKDRPAVVVATNAEARRWGVKAGELVRIAASTLGGGGGGKDDLAQGGGTDASKVDEALANLQHAVGEAVTRHS